MMPEFWINDATFADIRHAQSLVRNQVAKLKTPIDPSSSKRPMEQLGMET